MPIVVELHVEDAGVCAARVTADPVGNRHARFRVIHGVIRLGQMHRESRVR